MLYSSSGGKKLRGVLPGRFYLAVAFNSARDHLDVERFDLLGLDSFFDHVSAAIQRPGSGDRRQTLQRYSRGGCGPDNCLRSLVERISVSADSRREVAAGGNRLSMRIDHLLTQ